MFGDSSRLFILFNGPISLIHHGPCTLLRVAHRHSLTCPLPPLSAVPNHLLSPSRANSPFLIKSSQKFHSQSTVQENNHVPADAYPVQPSHPWPELSYLLESISISGDIDVNRDIKEEFVPNESLSMEFLDAACSCLRFAYDRPEILGWLSKDDIQVLINDGTPFLFKSSIETERRMKSFLQGEESNEATTVDLMKYILSYASNPIIYPERKIREATESSARNLLREMANFSSSGTPLSMPAMENINGAREDEQTPTNLGPTIKKSGEWMCPKCNFFNHGRNTMCLKCECTRPGHIPLPVGQMKAKTGSIPNKTSSGYAPFVPLPSDMFAKKPGNSTAGDTKEPVTRNFKPKNPNDESRIKEEEKSEKWFSKVAELHDSTDLTTAISDEDFPEIMPIRKGENRFVVSKKKDRSLTSPNYKRQQAMETGSSTNFVPFVPFPPDYFSKKNEKDSPDITGPGSDSLSKKDDKHSLEITALASDTLSNKDEKHSPELIIAPASDSSFNKHDEHSPASDTSGGWKGKSLEGSAVKETDPLDMSEEAKAERWFRRVAQIKDISELSQIPDEDFPEIMPMRKGVNRFVVSKRKTPLERRLTSTQYSKDMQKKEDDDR